MHGESVWFPRNMSRPFLQSSALYLCVCPEIPTIPGNEHSDSKYLAVFKVPIPGKKTHFGNWYLLLSLKPLEPSLEDSRSGCLSKDILAVVRVQ